MNGSFPQLNRLAPCGFWAAILVCCALACSPAAGDDKARCEQLWNEARAAHAAGEVQEALRLFRQAVPMAPRVYGPRGENTAGIINNYAVVLDDAGQFVEAEQLLRQALDIRRAVLGPRHYRTADTLNNLGIVFNHMGQKERALSYMKQGLELRSRYFETRPLDVAQSLENIATVLRKKAELPEAEALFDRALRIRLERQGPAALEVGMNLSNVGVLYMENQEWEKARGYLERALGIFEQTAGQHSTHMAIVLSNLSECYWKTGDLSFAIDTAQRALDTYEYIGDAAATARLWNIQGLLHAVSGQPDRAMDEFDRSRRILRQYSLHSLPGLAEVNQLAFLYRHDRYTFEVEISAALKFAADKRWREHAAEWILNTKGIMHDTLAERTLVARDSDNPAVQAAAGELKKIRRELARIQLALRADGNNSQLRDALGKLTTRERNLAVQIGLADAGLARRAEWIDLAAVRAALGPGELLIEMCEIRRCELVDEQFDFPFKERHYVACLVPPAAAGDVQLLDLGPAEAVELALTGARQLVQLPPAARDAESERKVMDALLGVRKLVLDPLLAHVGSAERLILSPDGALWLLPWNALPMDDGKYAIERFQIREVLAGRDLLAERSTQQPRPPVVFADPDYDLAPDAAVAATRAVLRGAAPKAAGPVRSAAVRGWHAGRLPGTAREAAAIAGPLEKLTGAKPQLFLEQWALEGVFKAVRGPRVLVLSTHGFVLEDEQVDAGASAAGQAAPVKIQNPLLRCGLLLAGCNRPAAGQTEDGVLTALEVVGTDLRGTDLVVLSACETGLGTVRHGEGVAGVRQAFQLAGARAVAATLWSIDDEETAQLMSAFFAALAEGRDSSAALRAAQLRSIQHSRAEHHSAHPYYWAAFTLTGY